jgi:4'-phosphopantetheinyl transferase EntD
MVPPQALTAEYRNFRGVVRSLVADEEHVRTAGPKRREEFAAGRLCAAAALKSLGLASTRVERAPCGAPIWPRGAVGSISHADDVAVAVAARSEHFLAIGVDVEQLGAVDAALWPMLFCEAERRRLDQNGPEAASAIATAMFVAKEAFYKAQWPLTQEWLDFLDVEIELSDGMFAVRPCTRKAWIRRVGEQVNGVLRIHDALVSAAVTLAQA